MDPALLMSQFGSPDHLSEMLTQSCSENNLKFICDFKSVPPLGSGDEDYNVNMDCESVSVILPAQCSVYQLRLRISMQVGWSMFKGLFKICILKHFVDKYFTS